ncbi:reprolysin-like metallopeptidase [Pseudoalteromonas 'SMAR']|uniref:reprolysin-like metallopeptidase n=1 Tax=Pseudoalteromonas 'SMAR' TaxID=3416908 RepID=UPI003AF311AF
METTVKVLSLATALTLSSAASAQTIDIGILYTDQSAAATANINTKINQLVSFTNQVYSQNNLNLNLRLVGTQNLGNYDIRPTGGWLNSVTDSGYLANLRNNWGADMIAVIGTAERTARGTTCGIAWVGQGSSATGNLNPSASGRMYSITAVDCGATTFVHELGHNQGLTHSPAQGDTSGGVYVDGMGYGVYNQFASIMAYPHVYGNATQYDYFSNPNWSLNGYTYGEWGKAFAWKTVDATKNSIANFK